MKTLAASLVILAAAPSQALADVTFYDNSDLTFLFSPFESRALFGPGLDQPLLVQTTLYPLSSPGDNADGLATGAHTFRYAINRNSPTGSGVETDSFHGLPRNLVRFGTTGQWLPHSKELTTLEVGEVVDASAFSTDPDFIISHASVTYFQLGEGLTPLYGDETYIAFSLQETGGIRYGYLRITFMEDVEFELVDKNNNPTGETTLRDLYMVTGWGFETELNTPAVVTDGSDPACPADVNGDGAVDPSDFTAWIDAYNNNLPACDQNDDGMCTPADFTAWVNNFNSGC